VVASVKRFAATEARTATPKESVASATRAVREAMWEEERRRVWVNVDIAPN
jgi:hypothetical protein